MNNDMPYKGKHVLILEGYARQSLPIMRAFKQHGCTVSVLCNSRLDIAYASRLPDNRILGVCSIDRKNETEECIRKLLKTKKYDLVFPLVDFSAGILSENKAEFEKYTAVAANEYDVFEKAQDKLSVMRVCTENNIPCPKTITDAKTADDVIGSNLTYPVIVKPRRECGARGFEFFNDKNSLADYMQNDGINPGDFVIQEYITGGLYNLSANIFIDEHGAVKSNYIYASCRWFPPKGGTGTFNVTVDDRQALDYGKKLVELMGLRGCCGVDFIKDPRDGAVKVLEINPRVMACTQIGFLAGVDIVKQTLEQEFGTEVSDMSDYKKDIRVRMSQIDFLWFLKSPDRFRAKPSWFSLKNTKDQTFSWDDPLPWFAFLIQGLRRCKKEIKRRS